jgi:hypothetical protein
MARWKTFLNRYDFVPEEAIWPAVATDLQHERSRPGVVDETLSRQLYFFLSGLSLIHDWHNMSARFLRFSIGETKQFTRIKAFNLRSQFPLWVEYQTPGMPFAYLAGICWRENDTTRQAL